MERKILFQDRVEFEVPYCMWNVNQEGHWYVVLACEGSYRSWTLYVPGTEARHPTDSEICEALEKAVEEGSNPATKARIEEIRKEMDKLDLERVRLRNRRFLASSVAKEMKRRR